MIQTNYPKIPSHIESDPGDQLQPPQQPQFGKQLSVPKDSRSTGMGITNSNKNSTFKISLGSCIDHGSSIDELQGSYGGLLRNQKKGQENQQDRLSEIKQVNEEKRVEKTKNSQDQSRLKIIFQEGIDSLNNGNFETAVENFTQCIEDKYQVFQSMKYKSQALFFDSKFSSASQSYQQLIDIFPNKEQGYNGKALSLTMTGSYSETSKLYQASLNLNPNNWKTYFYKGYTNIKKKNYGTGFSMMEQAIIKNQFNNPISYVARAQLFCYRKNFEACRKDIQYACKAMQEEENRRLLYRFQVESIKKKLEEYHKIVGQLIQAESSKKLKKQQRQQLETELTKNLSRSMTINQPEIFFQSKRKIEDNLKKLTEKIENVTITTQKNIVIEKQGVQPFCSCVRRTCALI